MSIADRTAAREFVVELLALREDHSPVADSESLFVAGRLDSMAAVELVSFLEERFGVDFADVEFDIELLDSIDSILSFAEASRSPKSMELR